MKFKKWLNKVTKIFVVLGMVLSMCFTAGNTNTVEAWDSGIPHEFTRIKSITYPEWWKRKCPQITKQWSTYMCTMVSGHIVWKQVNVHHLQEIMLPMSLIIMSW